MGEDAVQLHAGEGAITVKAVRWVAIRHPKVHAELRAKSLAKSDQVSWHTTHYVTTNITQ
eukprot:scaffold16169_cov29-Tisochrysis_lutea.AAC.1